MAGKCIEVAKIGNTVYSAYIRICDECGKVHYEQSYLTSDGKEICAECELKRLGTFPRSKTYIIDGDNDTIISVFHHVKKEDYQKAKEIIESITQNKVWWAMNNVTGKFNGNVYIVSKELGGM